MKPKPKMRTPWQRLYLRLEQEYKGLLERHEAMQANYAALVARVEAEQRSRQLAFDALHQDYWALKETQRVDKSARMAEMVERQEELVKLAATARAEREDLARRYAHLSMNYEALLEGQRSKWKWWPLWKDRP